MVARLLEDFSLLLLLGDLFYGLAEISEVLFMLLENRGQLIVIIISLNLGENRGQLGKELHVQFSLVVLFVWLSYSAKFPDQTKLELLLKAGLRL